MAAPKEEPVRALRSNIIAPIDLVAAGMWMMASGTSCLDSWEQLSQSEHEWWHACARQAVSDWMSYANASVR